VHHSPARRRASARRLFAHLVILAATLSCSDPPTAPGVRGPISMAIISGDGQVGQPGRELGAPLVVEVRDANDNPVANQIVNFVVTSGGGHVFAGGGITNANGRAQDWWTLGDPDGPQVLEVRAVDPETGEKLVFAIFHATFGPSPVAWVSVTPCCFEYLVVGQTRQYRATALDADFNPLPDYTATWSSSSPGQVGVDQNGLATAYAETPSPVILTATIDGVAQPVKVYVSTAGPPAEIEKVSGDAQRGPPGQPLAAPIVVRVKDVEGRLVKDALVRWAPSAGGTVAPASGATDAQGQARTTWTPASGANTLTATVSGLDGQSVVFTATGSASANLVLGFDVVASGLDHPVHVAAPRGDLTRVFIAEQPGRIRLVRNGVLQAAPFMDLTDRVQYDGGERGLFSIAFHPDFATNGYMYVAYSDDPGNVVVERYTVTPGATVGDKGTAKRIIAVPHLTYGNHNGGLVDFGPDGRLYLGVGDGGGGGDPLGSGQNLGTLLGKVLRIDVDAGDPYAIPADNPFVGRSDARPEIWAYGLRNPWRWTFGGGRLYIADVGQNDREEVNVAGAREAGLDARLYTSADELRADLLG